MFFIRRQMYIFLGHSKTFFRSAQKKEPQKHENTELALKMTVLKSYQIQ